MEKSMRLELRSCEAFNRLWSLPIDAKYDETMAFRCCSINYDGWLVADYSAGHLLHITIDGKMKQTTSYKPIPRRITLFDSKILVISTRRGLNFHKI